MCAMQVTIHSAKTNLSKLIEKALAGEEVVIAKGNTPVVKLVPVSRSRFKIGLLEGKLTGPGPDFLAPMDEDELALWEGKR
jgi:prevent-host-death family protein